MTIWISREFPLFIFERLYMSCTIIGHPCEKLWPFEFLESFRCSISSVSIYYVPELDILLKSYDHLNCSRASIVQFRMSRYIMRLNRTPEWKVMTSWISRESPLFNFDPLDILCPRIWHPCENLWPHEFSRASGDQFWASRYIIRQNRTFERKAMTIWILESIRCSISSVSIYYAP